MKASPKKKPNDTHSAKLWYLLSIGALLLVTYLTYHKALTHEFTNWDDDKYVYENPILKMEKGEAIKESFRAPYYLLYTPLTLISYGLNYWYQGKEAQPFILTNILLHLLNSLLVVFLVKKMSGKDLAALAAGAFFALHPMHVESVAWISERKDVLYTFFFFGGMLAWLQYLQNRSPLHYGLTLFLFVLSCLSKPSAVIFPVILVLMEVWHKVKQTPQEANVFKALINSLHINKIPFFLCSILFGWILLFGVETQGGQTHNEGISSHTFGMMDNILIAIYSFVWYPIKALWPMDLSAFYAYPLNTEPLPWYINASPLALLLFGYVFYRAWKQNQENILFTLSFYVVSIFLFIKVLTTVGAITYDRYFYVASFGFCFLFGIGIQALYQHPKFKMSAWGVLILLSSFWSWKSANQIKIWENSFVLMSDMIRQFPRHLPFAYNNRGLYLNEKKQLPEAIENFKTAIRLDPESPNAWLNAGKSYGELGKPDSAIFYLENCLKKAPGDSKVYNNLGNAYGLMGNFPKALENFEKSIALDPENANALYNLGVTYGIMGDTLKADSILRVSAQKGNEGARNALESRGKL